MNRGFLILAQNSPSTNYIRCAETLALSLRQHMPSEPICLLTDNQITSNCFDSVIVFPYGDTCKDNTWKLANDWQVYDASPFDCTIKLEADLYITRSIAHWFDVLKNRDLNICTTIRNHKNEISKVKYYRNFVEKNNLPDTYNAITYFKKSELAAKFFAVVRNIFENWHEYKNIVKCNDWEHATTDFVYAIAAEIIGREQCIMPEFTDFSFLHMKKEIVSTHSNHWFEEYVCEMDLDKFRINTFPVMYPLHYHVKSFADTIQREIHGR